LTLDVAGWVRSNAAAYFTNATAKRDYRVQLRGNRASRLFGTYLVILIGIAMVVYSQISSRGEVDVVEAQAQLTEFYNTIIRLLGGMIVLVAPALSATTVVSERQRRSLDLIFSAPVPPKYYLVGKMISSYRTTWMLLVLALPVTAACVVLGGASWADVLVAYVMLSTQALILTALALMMSTVAPRPVSAIMWSYGCAFIYVVLTTALGGVRGMSAMMGAASRQAPFEAALNPFMVPEFADTFSLVGPLEIPNWVMVLIVAGLVCKVCLLAAGALLSPQPEREIRGLRLHLLAYMAGFLYLTTSGGPVGISGIGNPEINAFRVLFGVLTPLFIFMPSLACYGVDAERRFWPNGTFRLRDSLNGTPAGSLPFLLIVIAVATLTIYLGQRAAGVALGTAYWTYAAYLTAFWAFFWAIGRYASAATNGLRSARMLQFASFVFLVFLPIPFISATTESSITDLGAVAWNLYILRPVFLEQAASLPMAVTWTIILALGGTAIAWAADRLTQRKLAGTRYLSESDLATA